MEREENAEECWISLRLGRSVALLLHYFAITAGHKLLFLGLRAFSIRSSLSLFYEVLSNPKSTLRLGSKFKCDIHEYMRTL